MAELRGQGESGRTVWRSLPSAVELRKLLGELLVEAGIITEAQLGEALSEQERTGQLLGHILVERGYISKQLLGQFLKAQRGTLNIDLSTHAINAALVHSLPEWVIHRHNVLPLARVGGDVIVAMLDPTDVVAMDVVRQFLGARVRPFLMSKGEFERARAQFLEEGRQVEAVPEPAARPQLPPAGPSAQPFGPPAPVQPSLASGASAPPAQPTREEGAEASLTPPPPPQALQQSAPGVQPVQVSPEVGVPATAETARVHEEAQQDRGIDAEAARTGADQRNAQIELSPGTAIPTTEPVQKTEPIAPTVPALKQSAPDASSVRAVSESLISSAALPRVVPRKLLGEMLVQAGLITEAQLKDALTAQRQTGERLGQILIERGYISRQTLGEVLEGQRGLEYVNLSTTSIDEELVRSLPEWVILQHKVLPFARVGNEIHLAMLDPTDVVAIDTVGGFLGGRARPFLTTELDLDWALTKFFGVRRRVDQSVVELEPEDVTTGRKIGAVTITESPDSPPIVRVLNSIISDAVRTGATDIHIEPGADESHVRFRIDGVLYDKVVLPNGVAEAVGSRLKVLSGMDIAERVASQDGRVLLSLEGRDFDLRIATVGTAFGERVAIRLLNPQRLLLGTDRLGLFPEQQEILDRVLARPYGMLLVTGPTGSGKTTTLYAALSKLNERSRNIMTIEDPVEYRLEGITQIPVREKMRVTFSMGLRAILRQDPDIVMVGEIRDAETASIAVQAALTGHLVLSTLHTNNAAGALVRLLEMGTQPYLLTSSVLAVVGQRLARVLCPSCKRAIRPTEADFQLLGIPPSDSVTIFGPVGCPDCDHLGYKGRTGMFEIMVMSDALRNLVLERQSEAAMMRTAIAEGMATIQDTAVRAVLEGTTSIASLRQLIVGQIG